MDLGARGSTMASVLVSTRAPSPGEGPDAVLLHEELDALVELARDLAAPLHGLAEVGFEAVAGDAEIRRPLEEGHHLRVPPERLGGDAPPVEADAAQPIRLPQGP